MRVKVGSLVKILRGCVGVPLGSTGLVVDADQPEEITNTDYWKYSVQLFGIEKRQGGFRMFFESDLEVIS